MAHKVAIGRIEARAIVLSLSAWLSSEEFWDWLPLCETAGSRRVSGQLEGPTCHLSSCTHSQRNRPVLHCCKRAKRWEVIQSSAFCRAIRIVALLIPASINILKSLNLTFLHFNSIIHMNSHWLCIFVILFASKLKLSLVLNAMLDLSWMLLYCCHW